MPLNTIAKAVGSPCFIYSTATLTRHFQVFEQPLKAAGTDHIICYAMKANSSLGVLDLLVKQGSGFDIVSGGELFRALRAGADPRKIVYSGVGKLPHEIQAALNANILMFNVESADELERIQDVAEDMGRVAPIALRVNPDIDPKTHPYISTGLYESKFGIDIRDAPALFQRAKALSHVDVVGVDCHIGSQITKMKPFLDALARIKSLVQDLQADGFNIRYLDVGGGLGIPYHNEEPPSPSDYTQAIVERTRDLDCTLIFEPGRVIAGNAGVLLTQVQYLKQNREKRFVIVDTGMHHLIRPTLYHAYQAVQAVNPREGAPMVADLVGPICESGDYLAKDRELPPVQQGDLLAIMSSGAYGYSMASFYNSYARPAEVLVQGDQYAVIRERDHYEDIVKGERLPQFS